MGLAPARQDARRRGRGGTREPSKTVDGRTYAVADVGISSSKLYFDPDTHLVRRVVTGDDQLDYTDYRDVRGRKLPFHLVFAGPHARDEYSFDSVEVDPTFEVGPFPCAKR